jgi:hypothetical protein
MREEVERVVAAEGWTKASLGHMQKVDSFLRESQRVNNNGPSESCFPSFKSACTEFPWTVTLPRMVVAKDGFTFSDGITIPHGAFLTVAATVHSDPGWFTIYFTPN